MLYYRVKESAGGAILYRLRGSYISPEGEYIAGELFTANELKKHYLPEPRVNRLFDQVNIPPKKTYFFFGCRFSEV